MAHALPFSAEQRARYHGLVEEEAPRVEAARQGSAEALEWLARLTLPARRKVAEYFLGSKSLFLEDGIQHGWYGVMRALAKYDPARGVRFTDYCVPQVYNMIGKFRFDIPQPIRIPAWAHEARRKAGKESRNAAETVEKLVAGGMARHVAAVVGGMSFAIIQEEFTEEDAAPRQSYASPADPAPDIAETACRHEEFTWIHHALGLLTQKERQVLEEEFGLEGEPARHRRARMGARRQKAYLSALGHLRTMAEADDIRPLES